MIARRHIGQSGLTATCSSMLYNDNEYTTSTSFVSEPTTGTGDSQYYDNEYYVTAILDKIDLGEYEWFFHLERIKEIRQGWLKPQRQLKPFNSHSKITYNLPRSRVREKKQIFLRAA